MVGSTPYYLELARGIPHPVMVGDTLGTPTIQTWPGGTLSSHSGGYPGYPPSRPGWGGTPSSHGGVPLLSRLGQGVYPIQSWWVVPQGTLHHPDLTGGTPSSHGGGLPWGTNPPLSRPGQGGSPSSHGEGGPWGTPHHPDLRWGTPHPDLRWGTPHLDLGWGTPLPRPEMGYPSYLDLRWGTLLPRPGTGYPPPASVDKVKI